MTNGGLLTADQILSADDLKTDYVDCPEWGGVIKVRAMSSDEMAEYRNRSIGVARSKLRELGGGDIDVDLILFQSSHWLVGKCSIDESGKRVFTDEQVDRLSQKSTAPIDRAGNRIRQLSGLTEEGAKQIVGESIAEEQPATI